MKKNAAKMSASRVPRKPAKSARRNDIEGESGIRQTTER
jgi:hypothetical protein